MRRGRTSRDQHRRDRERYFREEGRTMNDLARVLRDAEARGWVAERTNGGHYKLTHPGGAVVHATSTANGGRALANLRADLKRAERRASEEGAS